MRNPLTTLRDWLLAPVLARYEGATHSPRRSRIPGGVQAARFDASAATRTELVRRSRYFDKNSGLYNALADVFARYLAGNGLQVSPASTDAAFNQRARDEFRIWETRAAADSRAPFAVLCSTLARSWFVDGEVFVHLTTGPSGRPRIQLIEAHRVKTPPEFADREGRDVFDGVIVDPPTGRPIGYYVTTEAGPAGRRTEEQFAQIPAGRMVHHFEPTRPDQYRGLPFCAPVINLLHDLDDLQTLEMDAAKANARIINVIKTRSGEVDPDTLRSARFSASTTTNTGGSGAETKQEYYDDVVEGESIVLQQDDELVQHRSDRPSVATDGYWTRLEENICAGIGLPRVLVFPGSMQGTVYRGSLEAAASFFRARFAVLESTIQRIWEHVIPRSMANRPDDWFRVTVRPPKGPNVDVGRNMTAELAALAAGATNYELIYGPLGLDWREQFQKLAEQQQAARAMGLTLPGSSHPSAENPASDSGTSIKEMMDMYGTGVRAGTFTPTPDDESYFRKLTGLPDLSREAMEAWENEGKTRRPITLTQPGATPSSALTTDLEFDGEDTLPGAAAPEAAASPNTPPRTPRSHLPLPATP